MTHTLVKEFACPGGCGATLKQCGIVTYQGKTAPVFQCETCTKSVEMFGEKVDVALTFLVNQDGKAIDPAEAD